MPPPPRLPHGNTPGVAAGEAWSARAKQTGLADNGTASGNMSVVTAKTLDEILSEIRALPVAERLRVIERIAHEVAEVTPDAPAVSNGVAVPSLLGLMEDEPELVDDVCALAYELRAEAHARVTDE